MDIFAKLKEEKTKENIKSFFWAVLAALAIRSFIAEPFNIPSGSMIPSLLVGDFLFVSKYSYGYGRYSLPFGLIPFSGRFMSSQPQPGDIVVFRGTTDSRNYIKRLIGLPGDRIRIVDGVFYVNDKPLQLTPDGKYKIHKLPYQKEHNPEGYEVDKYVRFLPNDYKHPIIKSIPFGSARMDKMPEGLAEYVVPAGHYFVSGDNQDDSSDSRDLLHMGFIPDDHLIGKAEFIFFSTDAHWWQIHRWLTAIRWERIAMRIR
jgi:signal peptidase I